MVIRLAVLDMAGTTVLDDGLVMNAFGAALGWEPMGEQVAYVVETMGRSKIEVFRHLYDGDEAEAQAATGRFEDAVERAVRAGKVAEVPGAGEALRSLRQSGVKVALSTGFSPRTQSAILDVLQWATLVDLAVAPGPLLRGRPYPDLVFEAIMRCGVDGVDEVAVVGDTANDLMAGSRAGARIVAGVLTGAHTRDQLERAPHTHILESILELPSVVQHTQPLRTADDK